MARNRRRKSTETSARRLQSLSVSIHYVFPTTDFRPSVENSRSLEEKKSSRFFSLEALLCLIPLVSCVPAFWLGPRHHNLTFQWLFYVNRFRVKACRGRLCHTSFPRIFMLLLYVLASFWPHGHFLLVISHSPPEGPGNTTIIARYAKSKYTVLYNELRPRTLHHHICYLRDKLYRP